MTLSITINNDIDNGNDKNFMSSGFFSHMFSKSFQIFVRRMCQSFLANERLVSNSIKL